MATTTMTTTTTTTVAAATKSPLQIPPTLRYRPLPSPHVENASPLPSTLQTPSTPVPCRRCLRMSRVGEKLLLLSYDPFLGSSAYRNASPIFVHHSPACEPAVFPAAGGGEYPEQQRNWKELSVRAYNEEHALVGWDLVGGEELLGACERLMYDDDEEEEGGKGRGAVYCHVHYAGPGCFAVRIDKSSVPL